MAWWLFTSLHFPTCTRFRHQLGHEHMRLRAELVDNAAYVYVSFSAPIPFRTKTRTPEYPCYTLPCVLLATRKAVANHTVLDIVRSYMAMST